MKSAARALCPLLFLLSPFAHAQAGAPPGNFAYCQVEDSGKRRIWVSQVFPAPAQSGFLGSALATEFHAHVATLGGAGNKNCVVTVGREQADATRAEIAAIMGKRTFGIKVYDWRDVNWTPGAALYAATVPAPAVAATRFVYCRHTDVAVRKMVLTQAYPYTMPPIDDPAHYAELERQAGAFGNHAAASEGVARAGLCIASDTRAEAEKSRGDYRKAFSLSRIGIVDIAWTPPAPAAGAAPTASAVATSTIPAARVAPGASPVDDVEAEFWRRIASSTQAQDFEDYLVAYPQGRHAPIARLETRRLRGGAGGATAAPPLAAPAVPAIPPSAMARLIADNAFFRVPAGNGEAVQRAGTRLVNKTVPVMMDTTVRRSAGGNVCQMDQVIIANGGSVEFRTTTGGSSWAGLIPISQRSQSINSYASSEYTLELTGVTGLEGQPFPLVAGNRFGFTATFESVGGAIPAGAGTNQMKWSCEVGASGPASTTIPGMAGGQTELRCRTEFVNLNLPAQEAVIVWYEGPGCFVQDPTRG